MDYDYDYDWLVKMIMRDNYDDSMIILKIDSRPHYRPQDVIRKQSIDKIKKFTPGNL